MSTPPGAATGARSPKENIFTHKIGPLPMWAWLVITTALLLGWAYFKNRNASSTTATGTDSSQVPQFVNQTYTTVNPPSSPSGGGGGSGGGGTGQVAVPNVVGMTDTAGDAAIKAAGLVVADTNEKKGGSGGSTKITGQSPAAETMVPRGSAVSVTLEGSSGGGKKPPSPPVSGKPAVHPHARHRSGGRPANSLTSGGINQPAGG